MLLTVRPVTVIARKGLSDDSPEAGASFLFCSFGTDSLNKSAFKWINNRGASRKLGHLCSSERNAIGHEISQCSGRSCSKSRWSVRSCRSSSDEKRLNTFYLVGKKIFEAY